MAEGRPIYRVLSPLFWDDPGVQSLDAHNQLIAAYILTSRQANGAGLFRFSLAEAEETLAKVSGTFAKRYGDVCDTLNWRRHEPSRTIYLPAWWKWNPPDNPNHLAGAMKCLFDVPQTPLLQEFADNLQWLAPNLHETFRERIGNVSARYATQEQEQERDQEPEQDQEPGEGEAPSNDGIPPTDGKPPKKKSPYTDDFNIWYAVYPKKLKPADAFKAWKLAVKRVELDPECPPTNVAEAKAYLLEAVTAFAASGWGQQRQKCPTPANWLTAGQFNDDRANWEPWENNTSRPGQKPGAGQKYDPDAKSKDLNHGKWD